jgi:hypothetical protein
MRILLPAISLALVHIAGDNVGVVADSAVTAGPGIFLEIFLAYMVLGAGLTGLSAWIGARSGLEMGVLIRRKLGCCGKKLLAMVILAVSIPASALTGGYFAGWLINILTGTPHALAALICIGLFSLVAAGYWEEILLASNYIALIFVPCIIALIFLQDFPAAPLMFQKSIGSIDWLLLLALLGYNTGGMRPIIAGEAAVYLRKKGFNPVLMVMAAKGVEGLITAAIAYVVIAAGATGPLALSKAATAVLGPVGGFIFDIVLLCLFINTMAPAMVANARQTAILTGCGFGVSFVVAGILVYVTTFLSYSTILNIMSITGVVTAVFVIFTAYSLHKYGVNQQ